MMQNMFVSVSRPFYHSADMLELSAIPDEKYIPFIVGNFNKLENLFPRTRPNGYTPCFRGILIIFKKLLMKVLQILKTIRSVRLVFFNKVSIGY